MIDLKSPVPTMPYRLAGTGLFLFISQTADSLLIRYRLFVFLEEDEIEKDEAGYIHQFKGVAVQTRDNKVMDKKMQRIQQFLQQARAQFPDLLVLNGEAAWKALSADQPLPPGLQAQWRREQAEQAASRALKAAAPFTIALETVADRAEIASNLLLSAQQISDSTLIAWLQHASPLAKRLFHEQIEAIYPEINIQGYRTIATEATRLGWPNTFQGDLLVVDRNILCSPGAPKEFWWGVRSTGTDLYQPNDLAGVEWALARSPDEQRYYHVTQETLRHVELATMIVELVRSLDEEEYEQRWQEALMAEQQTAQTRFRSQEALNAYYRAHQEARYAEEAYQKVRHLKQNYP
jgi:hypothetical protein